MYVSTIGATPPPKPPARALTKAEAAAKAAAATAAVMAANAAVRQQFAPVPGYAPPGVEDMPPPTPESKTGLYIGLGIGAVVLIGGAYLLFGKH